MQQLHSVGSSTGKSDGVAEPGTNEFQKLLTGARAAAGPLRGIAGCAEPSIILPP